MKLKANRNSKHIVRIITKVTEEINNKKKGLVKLSLNEKETIIWTMIFSFAYDNFKSPDGTTTKVIKKLLKQLPNNGHDLLERIADQWSEESYDEIMKFYPNK